MAKKSFFKKIKKISKKYLQNIKAYANINFGREGNLNDRNEWLHGQAVKTSPFHGGNPGSIPGGVISPMWLNWQSS